MLYRVSLTGKHERFSAPQLGYLGYVRGEYFPPGVSGHRPPFAETLLPDAIAL